MSMLISLHRLFIGRDHKDYTHFLAFVYSICVVLSALGL